MTKGFEEFRNKLVKATAQVDDPTVCSTDIFGANVKSVVLKDEKTDREFGLELYNILKSCETDREFDLVNHMFGAFTGHGCKTIADSIRLGKN